MTYYTIKQEIRDEIRRQAGSIGKFIKKYPDLKLTHAGMSRLLCPNKSCALATLDPVLKTLKIELVTRRVS